MHVLVPCLLLVALTLARAQDDPAPPPVLLPPRAPDPFAAASESQLDSLYAPLLYLMQDDERGRYGRLGTDGKRGFLRRFWKRRDPTPETPHNEARERFYDRVTTVNRMFREGGATEIPGWRTDRGRIYLKYGAPDRVLRRPNPSATNPYEVWRYVRLRQRKFVFCDLTRFGNYALIWSDEQLEPTRSDWRLLLSPEALKEISRF